MKNCINKLYDFYENLAFATRISSSYAANIIFIPEKSINLLAIRTAVDVDLSAITVLITQCAICIRTVKLVH